jgi:hypothetical protein
MAFVTVFRRVPKPITGMIGILYSTLTSRGVTNSLKVHPQLEATVEFEGS